MKGFGTLQRHIQMYMYIYYMPLNINRYIKAEIGRLDEIHEGYEMFRVVK